MTPAKVDEIKKWQNMQTFWSHMFNWHVNCTIDSYSFRFYIIYTIILYYILPFFKLKNGAGT